MSSHISFSELKDWKFCSHYHKLTRVDGLSGFTGNEFTAFGTALHSVCEREMLNETFDAGNYFLEEFEKNISELDSDTDKELVEQMRSQAFSILPHITKSVEDKFEDYEVVSTEERLMIPIEGQEDFKFKGFIDLVLKTPDGKYHIIDWKTCSWGWDARKRSDPMVTYQLVLYKKFFAMKHGIDIDNIETHFALLKRTAKQDNVEFVSITSGEKRVTNAMQLLNMAISNIKRKKIIKNKMSCKNCVFYKTEHCQ